MQDLVCEFRRIPLPRTPVNKGAKKGRSPRRDSAPLLDTHLLTRGGSPAPWLTLPRFHRPARRRPRLSLALSLIRAAVRVHYLDVDVVLVSPRYEVRVAAEFMDKRLVREPPPRPGVFYLVQPDDVIDVHLGPVVLEPPDERVAQALLGVVGHMVELGDEDVDAPWHAGATVELVGGADDPRRLTPD